MTTIIGHDSFLMRVVVTIRKFAIYYLAEDDLLLSAVSHGP